MYDAEQVHLLGIAHPISPEREKCSKLFTEGALVNTIMLVLTDTKKKNSMFTPQVRSWTSTEGFNPLQLNIGN